jgi:hypothetical protein
MIKNKKHSSYSIKLKDLQTLMLRWADNNKQIFIGGKYNTWQSDFKYVLVLEGKKHLSRIHMLECNKLYRVYR